MICSACLSSVGPWSSEAVVSSLTLPADVFLQGSVGATWAKCDPCNLAAQLVLDPGNVLGRLISEMSVTLMPYLHSARAMSSHMPFGPEPAPNESPPSAPDPHIKR